MAHDEVVHREDQPKMTPNVLTEFLKHVNPERNKRLPGFLPLYRDMRPLLSSKDCVRFGVVKGCPVVLRDIVFSDGEVLPYEYLAGKPHTLKCRLVSLLLQAEDESWTLPAAELPAGVPSNAEWRGLFQLHPTRLLES